MFLTIKLQNNTLVSQDFSAHAIIIFLKLYLNFEFMISDIEFPIKIYIYCQEILNNKNCS